MLSMDIQIFAKKKIIRNQWRIYPEKPRCSHLQPPIYLHSRFNFNAGKKKPQSGFFPEKEEIPLIPWTCVEPSSSGSKLLSHSKKAHLHGGSNHPPLVEPLPPWDDSHLGEIHTRLGVSLYLGVRCVILELGVLLWGDSIAARWDLKRWQLPQWSDNVFRSSMVNWWFIYIYIYISTLHLYIRFQIYRSSMVNYNLKSFDPFCW